jgi:hypothetical protein
MIHAADIERLIRQTIPDVAALPTYVLFAGNVFVREFLSDGARGMSGRQLDLALRPVLEQRGVWSGRGPAIIIDDELILSDAKKVAGREQLDSLYAEGLLAVCVHEVAHCLEEPFDLTAEDSFEQAERAADVAVLSAAAWSDFPRDVPRWYGHEAIQWIRAVLHLRHRFAQAGAAIGLPYLFRAGDYEVSDCWAYLTAIGDEPARLAGKSFAEIRSIAPPTPFVALWASDVRKSFLSRKNPSDRCTQIFLSEITKVNQFLRN